MKRFCLCVLGIMLFSPLVMAQQKKLESILPSSVLVLAKSPRINTFVSSFNFVVQKVLSEQQKNELLKEVDGFKLKTGVDLLNLDSLKNAGVDTDRDVGFAYFSAVNNKDMMLFILPVYDEKAFPQKFIDLVIKANKDKKDPDVYPMITQYKYNKIYQVRRDVFITGIGGFFVVASVGDLVKEVIDVHDGTKKSLLSDSRYAEFLQRNTGDQVVTIYATGTFIGDQVLSGGKKGDPARQAVPLNVVNYGTVGVALDSGKIKISVSADLNATQQYVDIAFQLLQSGMAGRALNPGDFFRVCLSVFECEGH